MGADGKVRRERRFWPLVVDAGHRLSSLDRALLVGFSILVLAHNVANLDSTPARNDGRSNLELGLRLARDGSYGVAPGYHRREPLFPALLAAYDVTRGVLGLERLPFECGLFTDVGRSECRELAARYKAVHAGFLLLGALSVFVIVFWVTGQRFLAWAGYFAAALSGSLLLHAERFITEVPAAALIAAISLFWIGALRERRAAWCVPLGLCLAGLVLTKVAFAYLWLLPALSLALLRRRRDSGDHATPLLLAALLSSYWLPVGGWMVRNQLAAGHFGLLEGRAYRVLSVRLSYNSMRSDEFRAGFWYYRPDLDEDDLLRIGIPRPSFERLDTGNPHGFRRVGQEEYRRRRRVLSQAYPHLGERDVARLVDREMKRRILERPWAHLRTSLLLAYRGLFPEVGVGHQGTRAASPRLSDLWGLDWPRWGHAYRVGQRTLLNSLTAVAVLLTPLLLVVWRRDLSGVILSIPVLYSHGAYALASHFNPRYAVPEIPLRWAALLVLIWVLGVAARTAARSLLARARRPAGGEDHQ